MTDKNDKNEVNIPIPTIPIQDKDSDLANVSALCYALIECVLL